MCVGGKDVGIQTPDMPLQEQMGISQPGFPQGSQVWCILGVRHFGD